MRDTASLIAWRTILRNAYYAGKKLPQHDPAIREDIARLDSMCIELTTEIEAEQPSLALRPVAAGIDRRFS